MNKIIKQLFLSLMLVLLAASCNDEPKYYTLETPPDQMNLKASAESVTLERINETEEAISFTWSEAASRGQNTELTYYFRLYHADIKGLESELIKLDKDARSISFSVRELNNILSAWKMTPGEEIGVEAEVLAVVETAPEYMKPEVSKVQFNVIGYNALNKMYITVKVGEQKRSMEMTTIEEGIFNWKGELDICDFWFVRDIDKGAPAYMKGENDNSIVYSTSGEGNAFVTEMLGDYDITIDVNSMEIIVAAKPIGRLFLVTYKGGVEQVVTLKERETGTGIFNLQAEFEEGTEFRFAREKETTWPAYVKGVNESTLELKDEGAEMFRINKTAIYDMTVNMVDLSLDLLEIERNQLYLITSKNGVEQVIALEEIELSSDIFYLQRNFEEGMEFRFARTEELTWPAYVKGANANKLELKDEGAEMFKVSKTATYVMTIDMKELSLIFLDIYNSETGVIAVVGGAVSAGWDAGAAVQTCSLVQKDLKNRPEVISYTGLFRYKTSGSNDDNAFKFVGDGGWGHGLFATTSFANPFISDQQTVTTDSNGDRKWMLPEGTQTGTYTLEMNLHTMKINLIKE